MRSLGNSPTPRPVPAFRCSNSARTKKRSLAQEFEFSYFWRFSESSHGNVVYGRRRRPIRGSEELSKCWNRAKSVDVQTGLGGGSERGESFFWCEKILQKLLFFGFWLALRMKLIFRQFGFRKGKAKIEGMRIRICFKKKSQII